MSIFEKPSEPELNDYRIFLDLNFPYLITLGVSKMSGTENLSLVLNEDSVVKDIEDYLFDSCGPPHNLRGKWHKVDNQLVPIFPVYDISVVTELKLVFDGRTVCWNSNQQLAFG